MTCQDLAQASATDLPAMTQRYADKAVRSCDLVRTEQPPACVKLCGRDIQADGVQMHYV